jgi:brefeldin A-resistance guanine nucleotide exchange factor 1
VDSLKPLVHTLLSQIPDDPSSIVISVKTENDAPVPTNGQRSSNSPIYDPSLVYLLELCTALTLRDEETVSALGADVAEALQNIMRNQKSWHTILTSRTIFYILNLLHASYVCTVRTVERRRLTTM